MHVPCQLGLCFSLVGKLIIIVFMKQIDTTSSAPIVNETALDAADFEWVRPYLEKADADFAAGRVQPMEKVHADLLRRLTNNQS